MRKSGAAGAGLILTGSLVAALFYRGAALTHQVTLVKNGEERMKSQHAAIVRGSVRSAGP